jgi:hypothetical protein
MANPAYPPGAFFKHKVVVPRVIEKSRKDAEHDRKLEKAYAAVNKRENNICQVSGAQLLPRTGNARQLREHHHLKGRNVKPEWVYAPIRIALVSKFIHDLLTSGALVTETTDARKPLNVRWNRSIVKVGKEPIRLAGVA